VPALAGSAYDGVTVRQVLTMSSGVRWSERYTDPTSDRRRLLEAQIAQQPGGALAVLRALPRAAAPGSVNTYSTGETQIAGEIVRAAVGRPLADYLSDRIWTPAGMADTARWWLDSPDGIEIGGSGISATLRDYARFGQFILDDGIIGSDTVLPRGWVREATAPTTLTSGQTIDYGYLWWPATTDAGRRDHAFSAVGIHGQLLYVNPAARVVIVSWGAHPEPGGVDEAAESAFIDAVVESLRPFTAPSRAAR
jgi:CubicO group peptidase (beta-lactamase class C family)